MNAAAQIFIWKLAGVGEEFVSSGLGDFQSAAHTHAFQLLQVGIEVVQGLDASDEVHHLFLSIRIDLRHDVIALAAVVSRQADRGHLQEVLLVLVVRPQGTDEHGVHVAGGGDGDVVRIGVAGSEVSVQHPADFDVVHLGVVGAALGEHGHVVLIPYPGSAVLAEAVGQSMRKMY